MNREAQTPATQAHEDARKNSLRRHRLPAWAAFTLALAYCAFFLAYTLNAHAAFETSTGDLGIYDQVVWNTAHGRILQYSPEPSHGNVFLATHLQLILVLLAPLYWLWSDVRALIVLQTVVLTLAAWPVWALARWQLQSAWAASAFVAAYLLLPALQAVNLFVFHPESFEPALILFFFWFFERARGADVSLPLSSRWARRLCWLCLALLLMVKEDMALLAITLGAYLWWVRRERRMGVTMMSLGALWFVIGIGFVLPYFRVGGQSSPFLSYYDHLGATPREIIVTTLTRPDIVLSHLLTLNNAMMVLSLALPLAFLLLLDPLLFLVTTPILLLYGLSNYPVMQQMETLHYAAPLIPFALLAAIYGLGRVALPQPRPLSYAVRGGWPRNMAALADKTRGRWLQNTALLILLVCSLSYHYFRGFTPLSRLFVWPQVEEHQRIGYELMQCIPRDASLAVQDKLYPHLSQREYILPFWTAEFPVDYVLLDVAEKTFNNAEDVHRWLKGQLEQRRDYGLIASRDGYLLLQRGAPPAPLSDAFFSFARETNIQPLYKPPAVTHYIGADFENGLQLLGYDLIAPRDSEVQLMLYWQVMQPLKTDHFVRLYWLDEQDKVVERTRLQQPTLIWYPTSQWRVGEVVRVRVNTITWSTEPVAQFGLAVGVLAGDKPTQPEQRLAVKPGMTKIPATIIANGTLVKLGDFRKQFGATWRGK